MSALNIQLERIEADIMNVLTTAPIIGAKFTQDELYAHSKLSLSSYGWSFALDRLEAKHEIEFVDPCHWRLKNYEEKAYLKIIEEYTSTKVQP